MKSTANIVTVDARHPDEEIIATAAALIRQGGVVIIPTTGLYGLAADAFNPGALDRIYRIKRRDTQKALLVLIDSMEMLDSVSGEITPAGRKLMNHFWPGGVTFIVPARPGIPPRLTGGSHKVGVRWVRHPVAAALVRRLGTPLTGTSANISGTGGCARIDQIDKVVLDAVDLVLDAGPLAGGPGSTVADITGLKPTMLREGALPAKEIMARFDEYRSK